MNEGDKMAKLITVISKQNVWDDWISSDPDSAHTHFTQEEIDNVLNPYYAYTRSLPGLDVDKYRVVIVNNEMTVIREFDTVANAQNALVKLSKYSTEPIVIARNELVQQKTKDAGIVYTFVNKIV